MLVRFVQSITRTRTRAAGVQSHGAARPANSSRPATVALSNTFFTPYLLKLLLRILPVLSFAWNPQVNSGSPIIRWHSVEEVVGNVAARDGASCSIMLRVRACPWLSFQTNRKKEASGFVSSLPRRRLPVSSGQDVVRSNWCLRSLALHGGRHSVLCCPTCRTASEIHNRVSHTPTEHPGWLTSKRLILVP